MIRRNALIGGIAASAALGGAGVAWWRGRGVAGAPVPEAFWALRLAQSSGGELRLQTFRGRPLLVNFWATWCPPCVAEMPLLDRFARSHADWQVVGLAVDQQEPVRKFLAAHAVSYPVGLTGLDGVDLARQLGNASGGLPFSLVVNKAGAVAARRLGALAEADLAAWERLSG